MSTAMSAPVVVTTPQGIRTETTKSAITLDSITKSQYQKEGTLTAQIRQVVNIKSFYPARRTSSNMQGNFFDNKEFNFEEQEFESTENRMAFVPVPEGTTEAEVLARIAKANANGGTIYKVLSSAPILDDNQKNGIVRGLAMLDTFANSQALRYPANSENAGKLILDSEGRVQYRRTYFWPTHMEDQDARGKEVYLSPELKAELEGAAILAGQSI